MQGVNLPIVIGGGLILGVVLLAAHSASAGSGGSSTVNGMYTQAAFAAQSQQVAVAGQVAQARMATDAKEQANTLSFLAVLAQTNAAVTSQLVQSNAGIQIAQLNANAAVAIDQSNNANRLALGNVQAGVNYAQINEQWHASDNQLSAVKAQAQASTNSSIFNMIGNLGKAAAFAFGG